MSMRISNSQSNKVVGNGIATSSSNVNGRDTTMENKLKAAGLTPEQNKVAMETLKSGKAGSAELGEALQSKLKAAGASDDTIKSVLTSLNGGKAKDASSTSDSSSSTSTSSTDASSNKQSIAEKFESVLKSLGLSDTQNQAILKALNGGQAKGASSSWSSSSSGNSIASSYNTDAFES